MHVPKSSSRSSIVTKRITENWSNVDRAWTHPCKPITNVNHSLYLIESLRLTPSPRSSSQEVLSSAVALRAWAQWRWPYRAGDAWCTTNPGSIQVFFKRSYWHTGLSMFVRMRAEGGWEQRSEFILGLSNTNVSVLPECCCRVPRSRVIYWGQL